MEGSAICSDAKMAESPEESSWTFYIQGFMCDEDDNKSLSSEHETPSLVSDAASSAVKKQLAAAGCCDSKQNLGFSSAPNTFKKQKRSTRVMPAVTDCDLEDTASSPVNSPKQVSYINQFMNQRQKAKMDAAEVNRNSMGKGRVLIGLESDGNYTHDIIKEKTSSG